MNQSPTHASFVTFYDVADKMEITSAAIIGLSQHSASLAESRGSPLRYSPKCDLLISSTIRAEQSSNVSLKSLTRVSWLENFASALFYERSNSGFIATFRLHCTTPRDAFVFFQPSERALALRTQLSCLASKNWWSTYLVANILVAVPVLSTSSNFLTKSHLVLLISAADILLNLIDSSLIAFPEQTTGCCWWLPLSTPVQLIR